MRIGRSRSCRRTASRRPSSVAPSPIRTGPSVCRTASWVGGTISGARHERAATDRPRRHDMVTRFDVLLKNGWAVDPTTGLNGVVDVGVAGGRIAEIAPGLDPARAAEVFDVAGAHVVPGIIDLHMHASEWLGGRWGHKMMTRVGVTTALDMSGPVGSVMRMLRDHGTGLS